MCAPYSSAPGVCPIQQCTCNSNAHVHKYRNAHTQDLQVNLQLPLNRVDDFLVDTIQGASDIGSGSEGEGSCVGHAHHGLARSAHSKYPEGPIDTAVESNPKTPTSERDTRLGIEVPSMSI